jgi:hypothetical protein
VDQRTLESDPLCIIFVGESDRTVRLDVSDLDGLLQGEIEMMESLRYADIPDTVQRRNLT